MFYAKNGALNAKIMAIRGRLLTREDYARLAACRTVREIVYKMADNPVYAKYFSGLDVEKARRGAIERRLLFALSEEFERIYTFIGDHRIRGYMDAFFLRDEIEVLKLILNTIYDRRDIEYTVPELTSLLGKKIKTDVGKLIKSASIEEFLENLKDTDFYPVLAKKYRNETPTLFELEFELDLYYFLHLDSLTKKYLDGENKKAMLYINGSEVDLKNIMWTYRLKKYYDIDATAVYAFLIPLNYRLKKNALTKMAECKTLEELDAEIDASPYGRNFADKARVERGYYDARIRMFSLAQQLYPGTMAGVAAHIFFRELEIKNITSLIEGVRYGLKPEEVMEFVMCRR
ncbi:hypothetical protein FACS189490_06640 [Clostridia bacterium]|nr:hypothetical protein FACS189490_06640 [Clostridia bacterium]